MGGWVGLVACSIKEEIVVYEDDDLEVVVVAANSVGTELCTAQ